MFSIFHIQRDLFQWQDRSRVCCNRCWLWLSTHSVSHTGQQLVVFWMEQVRPVGAGGHKEQGQRGQDGGAAQGQAEGHCHAKVWRLGHCNSDQGYQQVMCRMDIDWPCSCSRFLIPVPMLLAIPVLKVSLCFLLILLSAIPVLIWLGVGLDNLRRRNEAQTEGEVSLVFRSPC